MTLGRGLPEPFQVLGAPSAPCHATSTAPCLEGAQIAVTVADDSVPDETVAVRSQISDTEVLFVVTRPPVSQQSSTVIDVFVEVQCDGGQFVAAAMSRGFPSD